MTDAQGKEEGICAGLELGHGLPWDGGSTHTVKRLSLMRLNITVGPERATAKRSLMGYSNFSLVALF